jgi:hypothetical protein
VFDYSTRKIFFSDTYNNRIRVLSNWKKLIILL